VLCYKTMNNKAPSGPNRITLKMRMVR